jgi:hypothetical protein
LHGVAFKCGSFDSVHDLYTPSKKETRSKQQPPKLAAAPPP